MPNALAPMMGAHWPHAFTVMAFVAGATTRIKVNSCVIVLPYHDPLPLAKAIGASTTGTVLVSGTVEAVCQKKGCWMVVKDGTDSARVMMKDHAFAVPIDARGKAVLVEGELTSRTFTEAQAKHLEEDKGGDPNAVAGERKEHVLMATAVEIKS